MRPIAFMGKMAQWRLYPPERIFMVPAAVVAGLATVGWWFWLVRLGATAPTSTRARVLSFLAIGVPLIVAGAAVAWWVGLDALYEPLLPFLRIQF